MSEINNLSKAITEIVKEAQSKGTSPYDTSAKVVRVEDGTAWVHIPGGVDETPAQMTVDASPGDTVQIRVAGGRAWITGNASRPPTDDSTANIAQATADEAYTYASTHMALLDDGLYVTMDDSGYRVKVTSRAVYIINDSGDVISTYSVDTDIGPTSGNHVHIDTDSVDVKQGETTVASFGEVTRIGEDNATQLEMTFNSLKLVAKDGFEFFCVEDLKNRQGVYEITETFIGDGEKTRFTLSLFAQIPYLITVDGVAVTTGVTRLQQYFYFNEAPIEGANIVVTYNTSDRRTVSFTQGGRITPSQNGPMSIVNGYPCEASGMYSYAEGSWTRSRGYESHAEGHATEANGDNSHAQNEGTIADGRSQTAIGKFNVPDFVSAFIIGNGDSGARSNALTVDWNGSLKTQTKTHNFGGTTFTCGTEPTTSIILWGNSINKVAMRVRNNTDNKSFDLIARSDYLTLLNSTDSQTVWKISPDEYQANESITFTANQINVCQGFVTNSTKSLDFQIPLPRSAKGRTCTLTLNASNGLSVRVGSGGYLNGTQYIDTTTSDYTITCTPNELGVWVRITKSTAYTGVSNNTACSVVIGGTLTFS